MNNDNPNTEDNIDVFTSYVMDASSYFLLLRESAGMFIDLLKTDKRYQVINGRLLAELMCDLFNLHGYERMNKRCKERFFCCSVETLETRYWPVHLQERLLPMLKKLGLIGTQQFGFSRIRYIQIHYKKWREYLTSFLIKIDDKQDAIPPPSTSSNPPSQYVLKYNINTKKEIRRVSLAPRDDINNRFSKNIKEKNVPFINDPKYENGHKKNKYSPIDLIWANKLRGVTIKLGFTQDWNSTKWASEFRILRTHSLSVDHPAGLVDTVLDWYCEHCKECWIKVYHAKHFKKVFGKILQEYEEYQVKNPNVKVSSKVNNLVNTLCEQKWPKGIGKDELKVPVQLTFNHYNSFDEKMCLYQESVNGSDEFAQHIGSTLGSPYSFTEVWWDTVYKQVYNWEDWSGDVMSMAWNGNVYGKKFFKLLMSKACSYTDQPKQRVKELLKRMGYK